MELVSNETLGSMLAKSVHRFPNRRAVEYLGKTWSYHELDTVTDKLAIAFLKKGINRGTKAGIWANECPDTLFVFLALAKIGATSVWFNTSWTGEEMIKQCTRTEVEVLFYDDGYRNVDFHAVCDELVLPDLRKKFYIGKGLETILQEEDTEESAKGTADTDDILALAAAKAAVQPDDVDMILFTSGSTSSPKGVVTTHYSRANLAYAQAEMLDATCEDVYCVATPMFHCFSMSGAVLAGLSVGACLCFPKNRRTDNIYIAIEQAGCTVLSAVPTLFSALLANPNRGKYDIHTLRTGLIGGAGYSESFFHRVCDELGMELVPSLGQTEATAGITTGTLRDSRKVRATTLGKFIEHVEGQIVDIRNGKPLPIGENGEICIRGYNVMQGYYHEPDMTDKVIDSNGFLHTGDLGYLDESGNLHLTGRLKELIIRGGENIAPGEIENVLLQEERIEAVKVIGVPDEHYGEEICACIVRTDHGSDFTEEDARDLVKSHLAAYKIPRYVMFFGKLPLLGNGKVDRRALQEEVRRRNSRNI